MNNEEKIKSLINEFDLVMSKKEMLEKYKWFSLASGIKNDDEVLEIMKKLLK